MTRLRSCTPILKRACDLDLAVGRPDTAASKELFFLLNFHFINNKIPDNLSAPQLIWLLMAFMY